MAGKRRGMSLEDKRTTILDIFHETKEVYLLKDIEKLASQRGVVLQSVKEVLQSLVDDDLVHQEKIGISNFFWSFPSEASVKLESEVEKLRQALHQRSKESARLRKEVEASRVGKEESSERAALVRQVAMLETEVEAKRRELDEYCTNDPERYEAMKQAAQVSLDNANRWTDNLFTLRSWMQKRFSGMDGQIESFFKEQGVGDDFDYIEMK